MAKISRMQIFDLLARKSEIYERLSVDSDWIDLEFMERTPQRGSLRRRFRWGEP
jgi:hypothetical protein